MNVLQTRGELLLGKTIFDMNLNVGYYARVSTDKDDQLNSLENQSNYFREMINENKKSAVYYSGSKKSDKQQCSEYIGYPVWLLCPFA